MVKTIDIDMPDMPDMLDMLDMLVEEGELAALVLMLPMFIVAGLSPRGRRGG